MASKGKKKTTMAKLARESRMRERRQDKNARKELRKSAQAAGPSGEFDEPEATEPQQDDEPALAATEARPPDA